MTEHDRMCGSRCLGPMTFHLQLTGQYVTIDQGGQLASRDTSSFMNGLAFLSRTVKLDEKICIRIEDCTSSWDGALRVGFTNICPNTHRIPPASIPELRDIPGYCVVPVPEVLCRCSAVIQFWINYARMVIVQGKSGERFYLKATRLNLNKPLWVFIDLYGSTNTVRLLGSRRGSRTSCPVCPLNTTPGINCLVGHTTDGESQMQEEKYHKSSLILAVNNHREDTRKARKPSSCWEPNLFLLQYANQKTVPSPADHSELTRAGLGIPVCESKRSVDLNWTWRELNQFICSSYPLVELDSIGFYAAKAEKHGRLCRIQGNTLKKLKKELGESVLYIIPMRDIVLNEMSTNTLSSVMNTNGLSTPYSPPPVTAQQRRCRLTSTNSSFSNSSLNSSMEDMDISSLLREFQRMHLSTSEQISVRVYRNKLLQSTKDALSNCSFLWTKIPLVTFVGEQALDCGGPRREFFRILMLEVQRSLGIFEGKPGHLFFTYDQMALEKHKYELAGNLIAWSVAHGGPGLKALDPCLYLLMCTQECHLVDFDWHLIPDADIQEKLQKILSCNTTPELHKLQREQGDWICECGFPGIYGPDISIRDVPKIYSFAVRHYVYLRTSNMIHQFTKGLNAYGQFWDMVKANWIEFLPIFTNIHESLSRSTFKALFQIHWSKAGTKKREDEEKTIHRWDLLLQMIEDQKTELHYEELLVFITGADEVPPLGFSQKPSIHFYEPERHGCRLPYANTCMMGLFLPRVVKDEVELYRLLMRAVRDSGEFGRI
ncbi:G2/M phase-specific E3 ubiquitin-protein ligase-like isoform X3 [Xyrauchen texanus]|uniref:G2/M phase-specific E3 ubiquitin-protein ligase-like isoform X1 n=1 Tax=Xyrauchen texanus TaxID=154827 RepID=UPI002241A0EF|nr:G2/M phase-specific E3 ubiquitin-protein ligase-like isoform X1 [Xyrauchen texanus]XP_051950653.1 G2/M phase-specific E3 ubiquitin-protein ligase-like isoform X2 [Xyrauchen texanus]XP_051950654.1 G2/M phase-specific E3 ubiquitin-protein ligase-like isoform X3 [Xyrauchen texanus]